MDNGLRKKIDETSGGLRNIYNIISDRKKAARRIVDDSTMDEAKLKIMESYLPVFQNDYRELLDYAASHSSPIPIGNNYPWHARIAIEKLLDEACKLAGEAPVRILCGSMPERFYNSTLINKMEECIKNGVNIKVVVWNRTESYIGQSIQQIANKGESRDRLQIRIRHIDPTEFPIPHFTLVGENAYRCEEEHEVFAEDEEYSNFSPPMPAVILFKDPQTVETLDKLFYRAWEQSDDLVAAN